MLGIDLNFCYRWSAKAKCLVSALSFLVVTVCFSIETVAQTNTDRPGSDFHSFTLENNDTLRCSRSCDANDKCYAWTVLKSRNKITRDSQGRIVRTKIPAKCFLKHPVPATVSNSCCDSGLKAETLGPGMADGDRPGSDFLRVPINRSSPLVCRDLCVNEPACRAWTYVKPGIQEPDPVCYLKSPAPGLVANSCCISGTTAAPTAPLRITGYEIVRGLVQTLQPLGTADYVASCPGGKKAIGAGYRFDPPSTDPTANRGIEIKGAMPQGTVSRIRVRNANAFVPVTVRALAVCIDNNVPVTTVTQELDPGVAESSLFLARCPANEKLLGGGFMLDIKHHLDLSGPSRNFGGSWYMQIDGFAVAGEAKAVAICGGPFGVPGWEIFDGSGGVDVELTALNAADLDVTCPGNKLALTAGYMGIGPGISLITQFLMGGPTTSTWRLFLINRDLGVARVRGHMTAVCVTAP